MKSVIRNREWKSVKIKKKYTFIPIIMTGEKSVKSVKIRLISGVRV